MGFMSENGGSGPSSGNAENRESQKESEHQELAAAVGADDPTADIPPSGIKGGKEQAARERLRIIRERIARGFYDRSGIKAKIAERLSGTEEIAQTWQEVVDEKPPLDKDTADRSYTDLGTNDSEEQASENL